MALPHVSQGMRLFYHKWKFSGAILKRSGIQENVVRVRPAADMAADDGFSFDVFLFRRAEGVGFNGPEPGLSANWRPDMNGQGGRVVRAAAKRGAEKYLQLSWSLWPGSLLLRHMFL